MKYTVFRADSTGRHPGTVEMSPVGAHSRKRISAEALAASIVSANGLPEAVAAHEADIDDKFEGWLEKGWSRSLPYFLATIDRDYADSGEAFASVHRTVLQAYSEADPLPLESYPDAPTIELEKLAGPPIKIGSTLRARQTTLVPGQRPVSSRELSGILANGMRKLAEFRAVDNAGDPLNAMVNFGPSLDVYVIAYDVADMNEGVYRYNLTDHSLIEISSHADRSAMRQALVGQPAPLTASVSIVYISEVSRHRWRYRHARGLRGLWLDSAKVANELLWELASRNITPHITPAFRDSLMCEIVGLPPDLSFLPAYAITFSGNDE